MVVISSCVLAGLWIEHFLLLGPSFLAHDSTKFPIGIGEIIITLGFLALFSICILAYFKELPESLKINSGKVA